MRTTAQREKSSSLEEWSEESLNFFVFLLFTQTTDNCEWNFSIVF